VEIDDRTAAYYRSLPGALGDRLRAVLKDDPDWGTVMTIQDGRCPMWRDDGLCRIQAELGHDALCKTCRDFPRLCHDYGTFREYGLELSCPEAARLILSAESKPYLAEEIPGSDAPDYDKDAMAVLLETRKTALALIDHKTFPVPQVLTLLLYYGYHAQSLLDGVDAPDFCAESLLDEAQELAIPGGEQDLVSFFATLEILTPQWKERLSTPLSPAPWTDQFRNLARYFAERYWLQAVSDYDLACRVKFIVASCLLIHLLGGDLAETAQLYSKEIENSDENVDSILDAAYSHPALTDQRLLGMLR
jgi:lysine-N-methylase